MSSCQRLSRPVYSVLYIETQTSAAAARPANPSIHLPQCTTHPVKPTGPRPQRDVVPHNRPKPTPQTMVPKLSPYPCRYPLRSSLLSFLGVSIWFLVRWPRTGRFMACRLPRYVPISRNRLIFSWSNLRASPSMVIVDSSAVRAVRVLAGRVPIFARGWMQYLARIRDDVCAPRA